jgi:predicted nucleic acid-binding protein
MIVVSNTTPILSLYKIGRLNLLQSLFSQIFVPMAVFNEISVLGRGKPGDNIFKTNDFIQVRQIQNVLAASLLRSQLDYGESEVIVLAEELGADFLVLDEKKARIIAQTAGQKVIGTIGILQIAKNRGLITNMKSQLENLIASGVWIDKKLYDLVLKSNNE